MAGQIARAIATEFPEFINLKGLLDMAAVTWPRYGLSAAELRQMNLWEVEMLRVLIEG
jgi:hypothetical protein